MTYADQGTLSERVDQGPLSAPQGIDIIRQIGLGLSALHRREVLHRDVKPQNVLFRSDDAQGSDHVRAMLGDLGLGKSLDMSSRLTMIAGTPSYTAPEQARGESLDPRADQYSLGALTYLVLTGRPPYAHASLAAAAEPAPAPTLSTPGRSFPGALEHVVARALAGDREERWPDVAAYVEALTAATTGQVIPAGEPRDLYDPELTAVGVRPTPVPAPVTEVAVSTPPAAERSRRWPLAAAAGAAILVATGATFGYGRLQDPTVTLEDAQGAISLQVPRSWQTEISDDGWQPPGQRLSFPALSVGARKSAPGVFAGLMPGAKLPGLLPGHPECGAADPKVENAGSEMVVHTDCPGVVVERVQRVTNNRWLWVQIRSDDRATANRVLDSIEVHGLS
jgi:eukaryotic-like serine/threonine-protein kinase